MNHWLKLAFMVAVVSLGTACSTGQQEEKLEKQEDTSQSEFPLEMEDATGATILLENEPATVVSLMPSNTEIIYALKAGDKLVGRSDFDDYPEEVLDIQSVGGMEFDVEQIIELEPDLILGHESGMGQAEDTFSQLSDAGYPVYIVEDAQTIEAVYETIESIGTLLHHSEQSEHLIQEMQDQFSKLAKMTDKEVELQKRVWIEISPNPIFIAGKNTFMDELLQQIHAKNAAEDVEGWAEISAEAGVTYNPEVIISTYGDTENISSRPAWQSVDAVEHDQLFDIDPNLVSRPGPRLVEGAYALAKYIYPEDFK